VSLRTVATSRRKTWVSFKKLGDKPQGLAHTQFVTTAEIVELVIVGYCLPIPMWLTWLFFAGARKALRVSASHSD